MRRRPLSRRRFLQTAGAAAVWVPTSVKGYSPTEMRSMALEGRLEVDVSKWELDTPALCVDLDALEGNMATMRETVSRNGIASRPHAKTHKCPAIARLQLESEAVGICTAKVGEAGGDVRAWDRPYPHDDLQCDAAQDRAGDES